MRTSINAGSVSKTKLHPPSTQGPQSLKYYANTSTHFTSVLFQCCSGKIGLRDALFSIRAKVRHAKSSSPLLLTAFSFQGIHDRFCDLCYERPRRRQTVRHLFLHCTRLDNARNELIFDTGHRNFARWLTTDSRAAAKWAFRYFPLEQFDWMREYLSLLDEEPAEQLHDETPRSPTHVLH
ncbi:hypothetical protein BU26DRAFT_557527 [Trematosphaeria pertusa]|uniref:Uncharacterized protein n=1 Tax=Trematosphaeria pertusa TaxID=390896 RepID=A0A6A6J3J6_9PLEO|nr:uncharacterized protein BU26DRAFT_557527 [Trematosphaeria pertusa]KAF2256053.1 hypothetical protein BU26DRAFT_557527 [Trematosphaeria pertusa]